MPEQKQNNNAENANENKNDAAAAEAVLKILLEAADRLAPDCMEIRRDLHQYPETCWTEFRTTCQVVRYLEAAGLTAALGKDIIDEGNVLDFPSEESLTSHRLRALAQGADPALLRRVEEAGGYTGAAFEIEGGRPGPTVAFRFDMDALPVEETEDRNHVPNQLDFRSKNPGCMHACGHDGHTAMGMVLARILQENRKLLNGKIKVIFQPAEEGVKGALAMVESGIVDDVDVMLGMHIYPTEKEWPALAGTQTGLLATTKWGVTFTGKPAHAGGAPQDGHHAILAAVTAISAMNGFLQDGRGSSRLNVGTISGGTARNVVPASCSFQAETRGAETAVEARLFERATACVKAAAEMYECSWDMEITGKSPAGGGDAELAAKIAATAEQVVQEIRWSQEIQVNTGTADDFCFFLDRVRSHGGTGSYMALLGNLSDGLHSSHYDFDESLLLAGVKTCIAALTLTGTL